MSMAESAMGPRERPGGHDDYDPAAFARQVRELAIDASRTLFSPDSPIDDVFALQRRLWALLQETRVPESSGIYRYLLAVRAVIGDRIQSWAEEELESLVA